MPRKKNKLRSALEKAAKLVDKHFIAPTPTMGDAKKILKDLHKLTKKTLRAQAHKKATGTRRSAGRRSKRK